MTTPKHTPGPWHAECYEDAFYVFTAEGGMVADDGGLDEVPVLARMRGVGRGATYEEMQANAELMAAAPTLLKERDELREALRWAMEHVVLPEGDYPDNYEMQDAARELLKRLEKEKP